MKNPERKLLADVLSEAEPPGFRETLLADTLQLARRRRQVRRLARTSPLLLLIALALLFIPKKRAIEIPANSSVEIVTTQPMNPSSVVKTTMLAEGNCIATQPCVIIVSTTAGNSGFHLIGDEELLAFAAPRPGVLIRLGPDAQTLIFADGQQPNH